MTDEGDGLRTPQYWQERAREARTLAALVRDPAAKEEIGRIAKMYEDLAERGAKREDGEKYGIR
jgi:O-methyltransferase involved in polyketide biosynthesis